jgi:malonyl-CoA/methylmalonyl-CoA synthetase
MEPEMAIPLIERAAGHGDRLAIEAIEGHFSYQRLLADSSRLAGSLLGGRSDLAEARVAFLFPPSYAYAAVQWGVWRAGGVAVPLCTSHPQPELDYVIGDAEPEVLVALSDWIGRVDPIAHERGLRVTTFEELLADSSVPAEVALPEVEPTRRAMIVYTSGTTSRPKGVVFTHQTIQAQIESLVEAWEWRPDDKILLALPLHHVHGIINVLGCALWSGARCEMLPGFDAEDVWGRIEGSDLSLFMAVPTIYAKLIAAWEKLSPERRSSLSRACGSLRLMVSGSAALPVPMFERWQKITGHALLERYGMTEIGMALSNPLHDQRLPGHVGLPLPGVEVRRVDEAGEAVAAEEPAEIEIRGPGVFLEYWRQPAATRSAFRGDWFRTGDIAVVEQGSYRILGRRSVDIIKTGGYKVSALEIEAVLREHPSIRDCAVVGLDDPEWGQRVGAAVILCAGTRLSLEELRTWGKDRLAPYKVPSRLVKLEALPLNAMGKVTKPVLAELFPPLKTP